MCKSTETLREPSDGKLVIWEEKNFISMILRFARKCFAFPQEALCVFFGKRKSIDRIFPLMPFFMTLSGSVVKDTTPTENFHLLVEVVHLIQTYYGNIKWVPYLLKGLHIAKSRTEFWGRSTLPRLLV